ncbi:MAG: hypothetical protein HY235_19670 [Acidobacteria bacterium]|nr:hypothetical protein [Acidobacteriota bacterium]
MSQIQILARRAPFLLAAAAAPLAFPLSQMGYGTLHDLSRMLILPAAVLLIAAWVWLARTGRNDLAGLLSHGALAGAVATIALELIRYPAFRLGFMPGNLPELMGVLLLDRFSLGPSDASTLAGFAYHFWNGACFGITFALLRMNFSNWWAIPFGVAIGLGFLVSPVVMALGVGVFGVNFGWHFAATVLMAHVAFGIALARILTALEQPRSECHPATACCEIRG